LAQAVGYEAIKMNFQVLYRSIFDLVRDWPAFRASGLSSVARFEREFTRISVSYLNPSGAVAEASIELNDDSGTGVYCCFNFRLPGRTMAGNLTALLRTFAAAYRFLLFSLKDNTEAHGRNARAGSRQRTGCVRNQSSGP
jgi:hypothetical protein